MKKHIPNTITLLNLLSGCIAILYAVQDRLELAALFVFIGIIFDFFDGFVARILRVQSELGVQLDSLADMVTCGVVPGIVMYKLLNMSYVDSFMEWGSSVALGEITFSPFSFIGFLITLAAAYRLAKFNIDKNQTTTFTGLPTPAATLFVMSLPLILYYQPSELVNGLLLNTWFLVIITIVVSFLMNANITLFALKFKSIKFKNNVLRYTFILLTIIFLVTMKFLAVPFIITTYVLLSLVGKTFLIHKN